MATHILSRISIKTNEYIYRMELKHTRIPMLNNNYQHSFNMAPIIFNDRLQSA